MTNPSMPYTNLDQWGSPVFGQSKAVEHTHHFPKPSREQPVPEKILIRLALCDQQSVTTWPLSHGVPGLCPPSKLTVFFFAYTR